MHPDYTVLDRFEYSTEAQLIKTKLESEGIKTMLMDEKTVDSDPLISQAIGGVKLLVHNKDLDYAIESYNIIRTYVTDQSNKPIACKNCNSETVLVAPLERKNIFYMLFPFFEHTTYICTTCKLTFK